MIERLVVVAVVALLLCGAVYVASRYRPPGAAGLTPGLTLVTTPGCVECVRASDALAAEGATALVVPPSDPSVAGIPLLTAPVAIVADNDGMVVMMRHGRAVARSARDLSLRVEQVSV